MYYAAPSELEVKNSNTIGVSKKGDGIVYTCSGGASFFSDITKTSGQIAIFLENSSARFVTTSLIQNLDSIWIDFVPNPSLELTVKISTDSITWTDVPTTTTITNGPKHAKLPSVGDYYVRIMYNNKNAYIRQIDYTLIPPPDCPNCFIYKPE